MIINLHFTLKTSSALKFYGLPPDTKWQGSVLAYTKFDENIDCWVYLSSFGAKYNINYNRSASGKITQKNFEKVINEFFIFQIGQHLTRWIFRFFVLKVRLPSKKTARPPLCAKRAGGGEAARMNAGRHFDQDIIFLPSGCNYNPSPPKARVVRVDVFVDGWAMKIKSLQFRITLRVFRWCMYN